MFWYYSQADICIRNVTHFLNAYFFNSWARWRAGDRQRKHPPPTPGNSQPFKKLTVRAETLRFIKTCALKENKIFTYTSDHRLAVEVLGFPPPAPAKHKRLICWIYESRFSVFHLILSMRDRSLCSGVGYVNIALRNWCPLTTSQQGQMPAEGAQHTSTLLVWKTGYSELPQQMLN